MQVLLAGVGQLLLKGRLERWHVTRRHLLLIHYLSVSHVGLLGNSAIVDRLASLHWSVLHGSCLRLVDTVCGVEGSSHGVSCRLVTTVHLLLLLVDTVHKEVALASEVAHDSLAHLVNCLFMTVLDVFELLLAHDGFADVKAVQVAPVADVTEAEVEVVAVEADPVANALSQSHLLSQLVLH